MYFMCMCVLTCLGACQKTLKHAVCMLLRTRHVCMCFWTCCIISLYIEIIFMKWGIPCITLITFRYAFLVYDQQSIHVVHVAPKFLMYACPKCNLCTIKGDQPFIGIEIHYLYQTLILLFVNNRYFSI